MEGTLISHLIGIEVLFESQVYIFGIYDRNDKRVIVRVIFN